jgi:hypothetical protein
MGQSSVDGVADAGGFSVGLRMESNRRVLRMPNTANIFFMAGRSLIIKPITELYKRF